MKTATKLFTCLVVLAIFDMIIPIPFTTILLIYVVAEKPIWFRKLVDGIYGP